MPSEENPDLFSSAIILIGGIRNVTTLHF